MTDFWLRYNQGYESGNQGYDSEFQMWILEDSNHRLQNLRVVVQSFEFHKKMLRNMKEKYKNAK